ncbi:hypothetical protein BZA05DRAFT_438765 [Tricharina praecox]|uniref:uncharacterized protein n=1 Tax=Tricharina praecox TaxID=43433 RepID=UPI00221EB3E9|nr:uncharacterized protein BZA05DRAFT_438765 [Tricharina praecox]KAI5844679.1 hypothetical protein BZA05DRAFT_438765 [Tricharina praecox]
MSAPVSVTLSLLMQEIRGAEMWWRCGGHHSAYRVWESKEADKKNTNNERGDLRSKDSEISDLKSELGGVKKQLDEITNVTQVTGPSMGSNSGHSQAMSFGRMAGLRGTMLPRWGNVFLSCQADEDGCIRHLPCPEWEHTLGTMLPSLTHWAVGCSHEVRSDRKIMHCGRARPRDHSNGGAGVTLRSRGRSQTFLVDKTRNLSTRTSRAGLRAASFNRIAISQLVTHAEHQHGGQETRNRAHNLRGGGSSGVFFDFEI